MYQSLRTSHAFSALLLLVLFSLGGCSDMPTEAEQAEPTASRQVDDSNTKLRHAHLMDRAITASAAGKSNGLLDQVPMIIGFSDQSVSSQRIASRYRIATRYEFKDTIFGMAALVDADSLQSILSRMATDPDISWVEPDIAVNLIESLINEVLGILDLRGGLFGLTLRQKSPWSMERIGADKSHTRSGNGRGSVDVDLYVLDTGAQHSDLNVVECLRFHEGEPYGCGLLGRLDIDRHGTQVAGAAAAIDDRNGLVGVAPGARVHAFKVLNDLGMAELSSIISVVDLITKRKKADPDTPIVVNMSLGAVVNTTTYNALDEAIKASIDAGVVYVIAAGNDNIDASMVTPAHVEEAITVGAYDENDRFAEFSNHGSVVDILAPGVDVEVLWLGNTMVYSSGTSIAAPHVAGAAALLLDENPRMSPERVLRKLKQGGRDSDRIRGTPRGTTRLSVFVRDF